MGEIVLRHPCRSRRKTGVRGLFLKSSDVLPFRRENESSHNPGPFRGFNKPKDRGHHPT